MERHRDKHHYEFFHNPPTWNSFCFPDWSDWDTRQQHKSGFKRLSFFSFFLSHVAKKPRLYNGAAHGCPGSALGCCPNGTLMK